MNHARGIVAIAAAFLAAVLLFAFITGGLVAAHAENAPEGVTRYVDTAGSDPSNDCLDADMPCRTVQHAVDEAADGDMIYVAEGVYTGNVYIHHEVALLGGFSADTWERLPGLETVLDGADAQLVPGDWDGGSVSRVAVISDGAGFSMWYDGEDVFGSMQIGLAASTGISDWVKYPANPVLEGDPGEWDAHGEHAPFVIKDGATYKMWYEGSDGGVRQLGYATSPDGTNWTKYGANPVLEAGPDGYDQSVAGHGSVIKAGGTYSLWYHAMGDQGAVIALATSPDGIDWTKQGPVLLPDAGGWDEGVWGPSVLELGGLYWMWYSGAGPAGPGIGVVTSTNGIEWTRFLTGPVLTGPGPIGDPHVIVQGGDLWMYYESFDEGVVRAATSPDGINWYPLADPVLYPGAQVADPGMPVVTVNAANVQLDGLTIRNGYSQPAGGVYLDIAAEDDFSMFNCLVESNRTTGGGAGAALAGVGHILIENSRIVGNEYVTDLEPGQPGAAGAIRTWSDSMLTTVNSLIAGNLGDAAVHTNGSLTMMNVTLVDNAGDVIFNPQPDPGTLTIQNSILYFNDFWFLSCPGGSSCDVTYSDIESDYPGPGNINLDPLFAIDGWWPTSPSPVIDAGSNVGAPLIDLGFRPRPVDGDLDGNAVTDMGAYEFGLWPSFLPVMVGD